MVGIGLVGFEQGKTYSRSVPCVLDALAAVGLFSELVFVFWNSSWAGNMAAPMYRARTVPYHANFQRASASSDALPQCVRPRES